MAQGYGARRPESTAREKEASLVSAIRLRLGDPALRLPASDREPLAGSIAIMEAGAAHPAITGRRTARPLIPAAVSVALPSRARTPACGCCRRLPSARTAAGGSRVRAAPTGPTHPPRRRPRGTRTALGGPDSPTSAPAPGRPAGPGRTPSRRISTQGLRGAAEGRSGRRVSARGLRGAAMCPDITRGQVLVIARPLPEHDRLGGRRSEPLGESPG